MKKTQQHHGNRARHGPGGSVDVDALSGTHVAVSFFRHGGIGGGLRRCGLRRSVGARRHESEYGPLGVRRGAVRGLSGMGLPAGAAERVPGGVVQPQSMALEGTSPFFSAVRTKLCSTEKAAMPRGVLNWW